MIWRRESPYLLISDSGYKIARFFSSGKQMYRPSSFGKFICAPLASLDEAKAACEKHFKESHE